MADIQIAKTGIAATTAAGPAAQAAGAAKQTASKFDNIRAQLSAQLAQQLNTQQPAQLPTDQAAKLETTLRQRLSQSMAKSPSEFFAKDLKATRVDLNRVSAAVSKLPDTQASASLRGSLSSIEAQFQQSAQLVKNAKSMDPQSLLNMQMQLYSMDGNLQLLSKVVDQATSGVKTIFQTQVG